MPRLLAGALLDRGPGPKYLAQLRFAELTLPTPLPKRATLARWASGLPEGFRLSLVVPASARRADRGPLRLDDDAMRAALDETLEAADILGIEAVVLPTGGEVSTGQRSRDRLAAYVQAWRDRRPDDRFVWAPLGLWDAELAIPFARRLGIEWGFDPLEAEPGSDRFAYARLRAVGVRQRFNETLLLSVLESLEGVEDARVAIASPRSFREASRLAQLAQLGGWETGIVEPPPLPPDDDGSGDEDE
jgi:hypothetical protein